jgi:tetratricopeptide (TPR) repeat protein
MSNLLVGVLGLLLVADSPSATTNALPQPAPVVKPATPLNDAVEKEYREIMAADDEAQDEVDKWIQDDQKFTGTGLNLGSLTLRSRVMQRFEPIRKRYEDFLQRNPHHVKARVAYGSFLNDLGEEELGVSQWLKARDLDPTFPAVWNNLGNYYGGNGEPKKAFECFDKALSLSSNQAVYYQNLATTSYLFRNEAMEYYKLSEAQIERHVMDLYGKALALDPKNFSLATEVAQTYYGFKPAVTNETETSRRALAVHYDAALRAWQSALQLAHDEIEREGIYIHLARVNIMAGHPDEARRHLLLITNTMYEVAKDRLQRKLETAATNAPPKR